MNYVFQFGDVWAARWPICSGVAGSPSSSRPPRWCLACWSPCSCASARPWARSRCAGRWTRYIEAIRNTPFLVQIFLIFFGLPRAGMLLSSNQAALLAMVVNVGAYATEIVRAGIESISRGQIEAGLALGLRPLQVFRYVVLFPALSTVYPGAEQPVHPADAELQRRLDDLGQELTATANDLQSRTFRSFEIYIVVTGDLPGAVAAVLRRVRRHLPRACSRVRARAHDPRSSAPPKRCSSSQAVRWTLLLSLIAFIGGGIGGLVRRARPHRAAGVAAPRCRRLHPVVPGHAAADAAVPGVLRRHRARRRHRSAGRRGDRADAQRRAFLGEIWRGCIQAIPRGQWEAATALGLRHLPRMRYVILPQAGKIAIAPTVGFLVQLVKSTSLASIIGFVELTRAGQIINNVTFRPFLVFGLVAAIYFVLCWPLSLPEPAARAKVRHRAPLTRQAPSDPRPPGDVDVHTELFPPTARRSWPHRPGRRRRSSRVLPRRRPSMTC